MKQGLALAAALLLAACGNGEVREGALTADEEQQLNDAAAMLDESDDDADEPAGELETSE